MIGETIGGYTLARKLGETAESELFLAEDRRTQEEGVVERWRTEQGPREASARFLEAMQELASLSHPGLLRVLDAGLAGARIFTIVEKIQGETLQAIVDRAGNFASEPLVAAALARQVVDALAAAHERGLFHGQLGLKDITVVIGEAARWPVLAKVSGVARTRLAAEAGAEPASPKRDSRAMGALLFELLTGKAPSPGCAPPSSHRPGIPKALDDLVRELLAEEGSATDPALLTLASVRERLDALLATSAAPTSRKLLPCGQRITLLPVSPETELEVDTSATLVDASSPFGWELPTFPTGRPPASLPARAHVPEASGTPAALEARPGPRVGDTWLLTDEASAPLAVPLAQAPAPALRARPSFPPRSAKPLMRPRAPREPSRAWLWLGGLAMALTTLGVARALTGNAPSEGHRTRLDLGTRGPELPPPEATQPAYSYLRISSEPPGAELRVADELAPRGVTPLVVKLPRSNKAVDLRLSAPGRLDKVVAADTSTDHLVEIELAPAPAAADSNAASAADTAPPPRPARARRTPGPAATKAPSQTKKISSASSLFYPMGD